MRKAAAFKVLLRTSTQGRTKLFLLGKHAPKGGALIDTKTYACDGAAGSFYCKGSYEAAAGRDIHVQGRLRRHDDRSRRTSS